ncbi:hypothetical protein RHGRI_012402 [Rhododendron griersonianum]|uniref:Uncharacterized protein n=1 Tax=Rhododendron griersonianum TaxID=479676 RepID=A0AAV6KQE8_9ERIC|nr:hypothetical protein RHGRI_012402 [Rhododendron griersonianum]
MAFDGRQVKKMGQVLVCSIVGFVLGLLVFISTTVMAAIEADALKTGISFCFPPNLFCPKFFHRWNWVPLFANYCGQVE